MALWDVTLNLQASCSFWIFERQTHIWSQWLPYSLFFPFILPIWQLTILSCIAAGMRLELVIPFWFLFVKKIRNIWNFIQYLLENSISSLFLLRFTWYIMSFPGGSVVKNLPANAGHTASIPKLGRFPREENGN